MTLSPKRIAIGLGLAIVAIIAITAIVNFTVNTTSSARQSAGFGAGSMGMDGDMADIGLSYSANLGLESSGAPSMMERMVRSKTANDEYAPPAPSPVAGTGDTTGAAKMIIKTGSLTLFVADADKAARDIQALALALGGFVSESNVYQTALGEKAGTVVIRVPADKFEEVLTNVKGIAQEVENERISSQDVTEEYVDVEAQLRSLRAEEVQYLQIMQNAKTIDETLNVSHRLSDVRGRIERAEGRRQYLARQVAMSSISITLKADADVEVFGLRWKPLVEMKRAAKVLLEDLAGFGSSLIRLVFKLPIILLWTATYALLLWLGWIILKFLLVKVLKVKIGSDKTLNVTPPSAK